MQHVEGFARHTYMYMGLGWVCKLSQKYII